MLKGVFDRIEDNEKAVILIEEMNDEFIVPVNELPKGAKVNTWLNIEKINDEYHVHSINEKETVRKKEKTSALMEKLRERSKRKG